MTFRIFENSTTADASDTNDNYYHIGQGSRLPMGESLLAATTDVYDLGSETYKWNEFHANSCTYDNLNANGITWEYLTRTIIDTATDRIEFSGLTPDDAKEYMIIYKIVSDTSTAAQFNFYANEISSSSYYPSTHFVGNVSASVTATTGAGMMAYTTAPTTTSLYSFGQIKFAVDSNLVLNKHWHILSMSGGGETYIDRIHDGWGTFYDTAKVGFSITSLQFVAGAGQFQTGTYIELWARGA